MYVRSDVCARVFAVLLVGLLVSSAVCAIAALWPPVIESDVDGGHLYLRCGIARHYYYKIGDRHGGDSGQNAEMYSSKKWPGRQYLDEHPGDWCAFLILVDQDKTLVIDKNSQIEIELADGKVVQSDVILIACDILEEKIVNATTSPLYLTGDLHASMYARSPNPRFFGAYGLYVRFPEGSCLSDQADGIQRHFETRPVRLSMRGCQLVKGGE